MSECFQGPCAEGEVFVPVDRYSAKCGPDAFLNASPKNVINFSKWSQKDRENDFNDEPFSFTYNDECYMTTTEAFCGHGNVARFFVPYKTPFCVRRDHHDCVKVQYNLGRPALVPCEDGYEADPVRNLCVEKASVEFD